MGQAVTVSKPKLGFLKRALKSKLLRVLLILIAIGALIWFGFLRGAMNSMRSFGAATYTPVRVTRGDLTVSVSGTGAASPSQKFDIVSTVKGEVLADTIEIGQRVTKDEVLYMIDDTDAQNGIRRSELSLERAQINYDQAADQADTDDARVVSDIAGTVTELFVRNGDTVAKGTRVATVADTRTLKLRVPFNASDATALHAGDSAVITLDATGEVVIGQVKKVTTGEYASDAGAVVRDVEITFQNPGAVKQGDSATAQCGGRACQDAGLIDCGDTVAVTAKATGELRGLTVSTGDRVNAGELLGRVDDTNSSTQTSERVSAISLEEARLALRESEKQLENYQIVSPIDGTIVDKLVKEGDTLEAARTTLAIVADMSSLIFTMNIDELDIDKIEEGHAVVVTADALAGQVFAGRVDNIGILGASQNGVTTYPVKVVIEEYGALRPGMNLNAEIIFENVTQVLQVPVNAVTRGNLVLVSEQTAKDLPVAEGGRDQTPGKIVDMPNTPEGYKYLRVSVGVNDGVFVEITGGLTEGMEVFIETAASSNMFGGMGGMNGGMGGMGSQGGVAVYRSEDGGPPQRVGG